MSKRDDIGKSDTFLVKYLLSCAAATFAETVTYPLDLTKTRLQIQGEIVTKHATKANLVQKRGIFQTAIGIVNEEGILRLWQGVTPAVVRHFVYTGVRMGVYEHLREHVFMKSPDGNFAIWKAMSCGVLGGVIAQFLASPTDLVKVQMQMEGRRRLEGLPPRVRSMWHAFRTVLKHGGIRGLWKGWVPNVQRAALVNMADLATYDKVKHLLLGKTSMQDNYTTHVAASACSGFAAAVTSTPADVVKTRIMNQPVDQVGRGVLYKGSMDCLFKTVSKEGLFALYKGFVPIWARMAPWSLTFWVSYEKIRWFTGAPSF